MPIKKRDFDEWRENPITEEFFAAIEKRIETLEDTWARESLHNNNLWKDDEARFLRTEVLARIATFEEILEADYFEEEDDQSDGIQGSD